MSEGTASARSSREEVGVRGHAWRGPAIVAACITFLVLILPPVSTLARRYEFVQALQFSLFAVGVPALFVIGSPWRLLHLSTASKNDIRTRSVAELSSFGPVDRWSAGRHRHLQPLRSVAVFVIYVVFAVAWRTPVAVDGLVHHPMLLLLEVGTLVPVGIWLWTELVASTPLEPRLVRPHRIGLSAVSMWIIWILAYFVALSHGVWYSAYHHRAGVGISLSADQQLTAGMMWLVSGTVYISLIYWNLYKWLQSEEDPSGELHQLIRFERMRRGAGDTSGVHG